MIQGTVNANTEATLRVVVMGSAGLEAEVEAIVDTGFTGCLTLPKRLVDQLKLSWLGHAQGLLADGSAHVFDAYLGIVVWDGDRRTVEVDGADSDPLVGMGLLRDHELRVEVVEGGAVIVEALSASTRE